MLDGYPKAIITKGGTQVLIRPLQPEDEPKLNDFFSRIPEEERWFLRDNVADPQVIHQWLEHLQYDRVLPMIGVKDADETIVANVSLHRSTYGALSHIGHLRIVVDPAYRGQRLGTWMLLDVIRLAMEMGTEKLVAEFVADVEQAAINAAHKLDFFKVAELPDYVKDREGNYHDLLIMVKTLHREWSDF